MPEEQHEQDEEEDELERRALADYTDVDLGGVSMSPNGALVGIGQPSAAPAATPATFICLRGPCRHYWELESFIETGNPKGTFGPNGLKDAEGRAIREPRQISRSCTNAVPETELTEGTIFDCNRWDPLLPDDTKARSKRIEKFYKINPHHRPATKKA